MFAELGWTGWLLLALGWTVAGLGIAWIFGRFVDAGKAERSHRPLPLAIRSYTDHNEKPSDEPAPITTPLESPAKVR